jgi:hypothetical protein
VVQRTYILDFWIVLERVKFGEPCLSTLGRSAAVAALRSAGIVSFGGGESAGDHLDELAVERALLRRQAYQVVRLAAALASEEAAPGSGPRWLVAPHPPRWLSAGTPLAPGCSRLLEKDPEVGRPLVEKGRQEGRQEGREEGRELECERLYERRLGRALRESERAALRERWGWLGEDRLLDLALDSSAEVLAAWLDDPHAR